MRDADRGEMGGGGVRTTVPAGGVRRLAWPAAAALVTVAGPWSLYARWRGARLAVIKSRAMIVAFQPSLFGADEVSFDSSFAELRRIELDERSWVDHAPGWVRGSDALFDRIVSSRDWAQRTRRMYEGRVLEPRLTAPWSLRSGVKLEPAVLEEMRLCLSGRYGVVFDSVGFNLYRDGRDSVAWHSDKIRKEIDEPVVVLVSLGEPRKFLLRPKGGGRSTPFQLGRGDLLVTGGKAQRDWEHCVPKVARAGPRISLAFRHGMEQRAYG